jgi:hypothetical protein
MKIYTRSKELALLVILNREFIHFFQHCPSLLCFWCRPVAAAAPISAGLMVSFPVDAPFLAAARKAAVPGLLLPSSYGCSSHCCCLLLPWLIFPSKLLLKFVSIVQFDVSDGSIF